MTSSKSLMILLNNVGDLKLVSCRGCFLSVLSHCRDIVFMFPEGHKLIPNLIHFSTSITRSFGASCLQYHYFLMTLLNDLKKLSFDLLCPVFSTHLMAICLHNLLVSNYRNYRSYSRTRISI